jgi:hypothetical protein
VNEEQREQNKTKEEDKLTAKNWPKIWHESH